VPVGYVGSHGLSRYARRGYDLRNELRVDGLPRGIITTDTRGSQRWTRPDDIVRDWQGSGRARSSEAPGALPDVSTFIARRRDLEPAVRNQIASVGGEPVLGSGRGREAIRPEPWARQRPVERGGYDTSRTPVTGMPAPRSSSDAPSRMRVAPLPAEREPASGGVRQIPADADWRRTNPGPVRRTEVGSMPASDGNADWRRQGTARGGNGPSSGDADLRTPRAPRPDGSPSGDVRAYDPRQRVPQSDARVPVREIQRPRSDSSIQDERHEVRTRAVSDDRGAYRGPERGSDTASPPIRRIVEGVRQTPPTTSQDSTPRRVEPSRASDHGGSQGQKSRPNRDSDHPRRDSSSSEGSGAPPPGG